jgi:hypothetical protein
MIGQKLEVAKISHFELEHEHGNYTVTSDLMSQTPEWMLYYATTENTLVTGRRRANTILRLNPILFSEADLIRLDGWEAKRRRQLLPVQPPTKLSHLLRMIGAQLDKNAAQTFRIFWTPNSIVLDYKRAGGFTDRLWLSPETIGRNMGGGFRRVITALPRPCGTFTEKSW